MTPSRIGHVRVPLLLLLASSACAVQTVPVKGDDGAPADPATIAAMQKSIDSLTTELAQLETATKALQVTASSSQAKTEELQAKLAAFEVPYCPRLLDADGHVRAYARDPSFAGGQLCVFGADEMVKVGAFWIDRYEAVLGSDQFYSNYDGSPSTMATCNGPSLPYVSGPGPDLPDTYPDSFPVNGNWTKKAYACSIAGHYPSRKMTWFQGQQACTAAGKRLCTNAEWQAAVAGTPDPGPSDGQDGACVTEAVGPRINGGATLCHSNYGADDMIGNLLEWVSDWLASPATTSAGAVDSYTTWGPNYGNDFIFNIASYSFDYDSGGVFPRPSAVRRGGGFLNDPQTGEQAGAFALTLYAAPSAVHRVNGVRCCVGSP